MTSQQMQLLKEISTKNGFAEWFFQHIDDSQLQPLVEAGLVEIKIGEGYVGGLKEVNLTPKGEELIKDYCECCGCNPCDCGFGS